MVLFFYFLSFPSTPKSLDKILDKYFGDFQTTIFILFTHSFQVAVSHGRRANNIGRSLLAVYAEGGALAIIFC